MITVIDNGFGVDSLSLTGHVYMYDGTWLLDVF